MRVNPYLNYGMIMESIRERFVGGLREEGEGVGGWVDGEVERERGRDK